MPLAWLAYLNPTLTLSDGTNTTAINQYMSLLPQSLSGVGVAKVLTMMLNLALSGIGQNLPWESMLSQKCFKKHNVLTMSRSSKRTHSLRELSGNRD